LNKKNLLKKANSKSPFDRDKGAQVFERIFEMVKEGVLKDKSFVVENFGRFVIEHRGMHREIDFKSRTEILVPPKNKIKFIPLFLIKKR